MAICPKCGAVLDAKSQCYRCSIVGTAVEERVVMPEVTDFIPEDQPGPDKLLILVQALAFPLVSIPLDIGVVAVDRASLGPDLTASDFAPIVLPWVMAAFITAVLAKRAKWRCGWFKFGGIFFLLGTLFRWFEVIFFWLPLVLMTGRIG